MGLWGPWPPVKCGGDVEQVVVPGPLGFPAKNFGETKFRNTQNYCTGMIVRSYMPC